MLCDFSSLNLWRVNKNYPVLPKKYSSALAQFKYGLRKQLREAVPRLHQIIKLDLQMGVLAPQTDSEDLYEKIPKRGLNSGLGKI